MQYIKAGAEWNWMRSNLEEKGLSITRDAMVGSAAKHEYGRAHIATQARGFIAPFPPDSALVWAYLE